ncbi:hypothetical protein [Amycolatopsis sp. cg13]|uniref:hypothetical protein n=1 Tax=Amycolatopsis sp. cg13 TaxID=3238807 RepID=UPI0035267037
MGVLGAHPGGIEVPHQVPPTPQRFVNRAGELAKAQALLGGGDGPGTRIAVFSGLPGVGKSWLARRYVEENRGVFPGGELYIDYGAAGQGTEAVSDALTSCLLALGVANEAIPARLTDRAALFRTKTAAAPTLVVLDDVTDPAQVLSFVPNSPGSAVLVTSNARLTDLRFEGAEVLPVPPLDDESAMHLVRELCGPAVTADEAGLRRLVQECGGLPVALRVAVQRLLSSPGLTVGALAETIAEHGDDKTTATFRMGYAELPAPAARAYRLLGAVAAPAGGFDLDLAAAVLDGTAAETGQSLGIIAEAGLLQIEPGEVFRFHTLVRRHAADRALAEDSSGELTAAARRLVEFLRGRAAFADLTVTGSGRYRSPRYAEVLKTGESPFGEDRPAALDWLDTRRPAIAAAIRAALRHKWYDLSAQLAEAVTALYANRRYLVDWTETSAVGAQAAALADNAAAEARLRSFSSRAWVELGRPERARSELDSAFSLLDKVTDVRLRASVWEMDGRYHETQGDWERALASFRRSLELFDSVEDGRGAASLTYFIGCAQLALDDVLTAEKTLLRSLSLLEQHDAKMLGRAMRTLGRLETARGQDAAAREWFAKSVRVLRDNGDLFHESWTQEDAAELAGRLGDRQAERAAVARMAEIHARLGSDRVAEFTRRLAELDGR